LTDEKIKVEVETQTFRFTPSEPIDHDGAVTLGGGSKSGEYVVISHEEPHATFVIEPYSFTESQEVKSPGWRLKNYCINSG